MSQRRLPEPQRATQDALEAGSRCGRSGGSESLYEPWGEITEAPEPLEASPGLLPGLEEA